MNHMPHVFQFDNYLQIEWFFNGLFIILILYAEIKWR